MKHRDFSEYIHGYLKVLWLGRGLDNGPRARHGKIGDWKYTYPEEAISTVAEDEPAFTPYPIH
ncbi:hypothetical protein PM082_010143 [Marasmius tenuissimus]|nr:hypothetical protein PM082_010143 [Marasmius tenuissimus]